jgi:NADH:ubiquinone oxidoreductase subunit 6 (subunit J)
MLPLILSFTVFVVLYIAMPAAALVWLCVEVGKIAPLASGRRFEDLASELRKLSIWWYFWVFASIGVLLWFLGRVGIDSHALRGLVLLSVLFFPVARGARTRAWWIFETILIAGVVAGLYGYLISPEGMGFDNRLFWLLLIFTLGLLCMALLTRGFLRICFSVLTGVIAVSSVLAFVDKGTFHDFFFWNLAVVCVGSGLMILVSRDIVHMAFWLLACLAGVAGFYLLLGADFLGFTQVLVYIGGILILFLFGVMLTHRADVPIKPQVSWRVLVPGVLAGIGVTVLLVFVAAGNNWKELDQSEVATVGSVTQLSKYYDTNPAAALARPGAESTSFGLGVRFMSTYILPFEVVSILLLVAMVGATYVARGKSEGDSVPLVEVEGAAAVHEEGGAA